MPVLFYLFSVAACAITANVNTRRKTSRGIKSLPLSYLCNIVVSTPKRRDMLSADMLL